MIKVHLGRFPIRQMIFPNQLGKIWEDLLAFIWFYCFYYSPSFVISCNISELGFFLLSPPSAADRAPKWLFMLTMGQDVVVECQNHSQARLRNRVATVVPSRSSKKVEENERKRLPANRYQYLNRLDDDLRELNRSYSSSLDYESMNSRKLSADNEVLKRGSMYQSSKEVRRMRKQREGRIKVDSGCNEDAFISFEIIDHVPQHVANKSNQLPDKKFLPLVSSNADLVDSISTSSTEFLDLSFRDLLNKPFVTDKTCLDFVPAKGSGIDDFVEICLHSVDKQTPREVVPRFLEPGPLKDRKAHCYEKIHPAENTFERDSANILPKCFSENAKMSHAFLGLEHSIADARGSKTKFSQLKRIFDPIMKSKSLRDSFPAGTQNTGLKAALQKSLLHEISTKEEDIKLGSCLTQGAFLQVAISPAHLHGILKLDIENGHPSFEFSLQDPEEVLLAKTWKTASAFNWVYTFHSSKKKINTSRGTDDKHGTLPPLVGQMQVSCYLCSELRENGSLFNSTVTEFVLYDITRARRNFSIEERSKCCSDPAQPVSSNVVKDLTPAGAPERNKSAEYLDSSRLGLSSCNSDTSASYPWLSKDLHPQHEIAAIVIQVPFNKKENSIEKEEFRPKGNQKASRCSPIDRRKETRSHMNYPIVKVVTPSGNHGLPNTVGAGPSSLLDRWRFGGGCDCGGWDMACPIIVFDNQQGDDWINHSASEFQTPMSLFLQGSKENVPALTIMADKKGQYSVYFHAQFSAQQAFSICIAILHSSELSSAITQEKTRQRLYSNSVRLLLEEEVRHLIEAAESEEKRKAKEGVEQIPPFFLDTPFSPMGRV
ncbi:uncharacterized protein LOC122041469 isoform X1 [Zingiber officinale]|uniref:uncharacterized protein LOC122041469 isoform X1 n=2 Tax=Zingiber officinale TaxID=94328 RepID=UPI001C4D970C|nr:uncharacterized protein LOC122041469 isoform X1 [Zingiber officinale]